MHTRNETPTRAQNNHATSQHHETNLALQAEKTATPVSALLVESGGKELSARFRGSVGHAVQYLSRKLVLMVSIILPNLPAKREVSKRRCGSRQHAVNATMMKYNMKDAKHVLTLVSLLYSGNCNGSDSLLVDELAEACLALDDAIGDVAPARRNK